MSFGIKKLDKIPNNALYCNLCTTRVGYYYHSVNVISLSLSQNNHIKRLKLYKFFLHKNKEWMTSVGAHDFSSTNPKQQLNQFNKQSL